MKYYDNIQAQTSINSEFMETLSNLHTLNNFLHFRIYLNQNGAVFQHYKHSAGDSIPFYSFWSTKTLFARILALIPQIGKSQCSVLHPF